jgi:hypothetical protein
MLRMKSGNKNILIVEDSDFPEESVCGSKIDMLICTKKKFASENFQQAIIPMLLPDGHLIIL